MTAPPPPFEGQTFRHVAETSLLFPPLCPVPEKPLRTEENRDTFPPYN